MVYGGFPFLRSRFDNADGLFVKKGMHTPKNSHVDKFSFFGNGERSCHAPLYPGLLCLLRIELMLVDPYRERIDISAIENCISIYYAATSATDNNFSAFSLFLSLNRDKSEQQKKR